MSKTTQNPDFKQDLAKLRKKWPGIMITTRDRAKFNETMRTTNENTRKRKKRKKKVAT